MIRATDAYAVSVRLTGGQPRLALGRHDGAAASAAELPEPVELPPAPRQVVPRRDRLADRWSAFREAWSQTTFYLTDPESWR